jgi:20S proteasome subunit beta 2
MHRLETGTEPRVITALTRLKQRLFQYDIRYHDVTNPTLTWLMIVAWYRYQGHVSAALVLGGVDVTGRRIFFIYKHEIE